MRARVIRGALALPLLMAAAALPVWAERGDDSDRKSKNGRTEATIDGVAVVVEYGRPNVNGRQIWGGLVPYDSLWRTGADEATTIQLDQDVLIQGQPLAAGTYSLFTIPGETEWTFIFNKVAQQWGAFGYDEAEDALRVTVTPAPAEHVESMEFVVEGASVQLRWAEVAVGFDVAAAG